MVNTREKIPNHLQVRIEATAELILLRPLDRFVRELILQVPELAEPVELVDKLELAFSEAYTNICRHAYPSGESGPVAVFIELTADRLVIQFEDEGVGFDPANVAPPDLDSPKEGGLGVWLICKIMDEYTYYCDESGKNILRLAKSLA